MPAPVSYEVKRLDASNRRKAAVLKAAGLCFAEHGFRRTTIAEIAAQAGVSKGLVFHFFASKPALFTCVVEDSLEQWRLLSDYRLSEAETTGGGLDELRSLFLASFDFVEQHPVLSLFSRSEEAMLGSFKSEFARKNRSWRARLCKTINRGIAKGEIRQGLDVVRLSEIFHELQTALIRNVSIQKTSCRYDKKTVTLAIDVLLRGVANTQAAVK